MYRFGMLLAAAALCVSAAEWNARAAAGYLDRRQAEWSAWPHAQKPGGPCLSCHTGLFYLLARPALRETLGEAASATPESELLAAVRGRAGAMEAAAAGAVPGTGAAKGLLADQLLATQAVLTPLVLAYHDRAAGKLSDEGEEAFRRMWSLQVHTGPARGAWAWSSFDLDPWEMPESAYFGAALAAVATGAAPGGYQDRAEIRANIAELRQYLRANLAAQPMHNRLAALWASGLLRDLLPDSARQETLTAMWRSQSADGGFSIGALGPWKPREAVPSSPESNGYATALAAFTVRQSGVRPDDPRLARALAWLRTHQDPDGSWAALSMNKVRERGSMPAEFMRDAATALAVMALTGK
jgi:hypothetical protein